MTEKITSLNFNIRSGASNSKRMIYAVVRINDKQTRISLGVKVYSQFWDKKKQECIVSECMNPKEIENVTRINQLLCAIKFGYLEKFSYVCIGTFQGIVKDAIKKLFNLNETEMANKHPINNKRGICATTLLNQAFSLYYGENEQEEQKGNSTWKQNRRLLNEYFHYMKEKNVPNSVKGALSQTAINDYKDYLVNERKLAVTSINQRVGIVRRLINNHLVSDTKFLKHHIKNVGYKQVKDSRPRSESQRTALTQQEVEAIENAKGLTPTQKEYRDIFLMQIYTSMRVSDVRKIFNKSEYEEETLDNGERRIAIRAKKSRKDDGYYTITVDSKIQAILDKYANGFSEIDIKVNDDAFEQKLNDSIRQIAKKAKLFREHTYYKSKGNDKEKHTARICDIITSHFARYTFITQKIREGYDTKEIKNKTAHTDDSMIDKVYRRSTNADRFAKSIKADKRVKALNGETNFEEKWKKELKNVLYYLDVDPEEYEGKSLDELKKIQDRVTMEYIDKYPQKAHYLKEIFNEEDGKKLKEKRDELKKKLEES